MKYLCILIIVILILGCENERKKIEIIPDYDEIYLPQSEVDTPIRFEDDEHSDKLNKGLLEIGNSIIGENKLFPDRIDFHFRLYISEIGNIDFIKNLKRPQKNNNLLVDEFLEKIGALLTTKTITPATKNGFNVKFRTDFKIGFDNQSDSLRLFLPDFLENMPTFEFNIPDKEDYLAEIDEMPKPIGGIKALAAKVVYPKNAKDDGVQGRVFVKAYINEKGIVVKTKILRGIGSGCDEAAVNAISATRFTPGKHKGKPVKVQVSIPILFKLN